MKDHITSSSYITVLKWRRCCHYLQCSLHAVGSLASVDRSHPKHTLSLLSEIENKQTKTCLQKQLVNIITFNQDRLINTNNLYTFCLQKGFWCSSIGICLYAVWRGGKFTTINPLNPNIKIEILTNCPYTFSIEVVGRICWNINYTHLPWSCTQFSWPLCFLKDWYYTEKFDADDI